MGGAAAQTAWRRARGNAGRIWVAACLLWVGFAIVAEATPIADSSAVPSVMPSMPSTLAPPPPQAFDDIVPLTDDLVALSPSAAAPSGAGLFPMDLPEESPRSGDTLAQVLRSIAIVHREPDRRASAETEQRVRAIAEEEDGDWLGWRETILNSTFAGAALQSLVDVHAEGGNPAGFSVLGIGNFRLEISQGPTEDARELSPSPTRQVGAASDSSAEVQNWDIEGRKPMRIGLLIAIVLNFLATPLGILLETTIALILTFWMAVRSIAVIREARSPVAQIAPGPGRSKRRTSRRRRHHRLRRRGRRRKIARSAT